MDKKTTFFILILVFSIKIFASPPEDLKICLGDWKIFSKEHFIKAQLGLVDAILNKDTSLLKKFTNQSTKVNSDKTFNFLELNEKQLGLLLNDQEIIKASKEGRQILKRGKYIDCVGYRGLMLGNGDVWFTVNEDYKIHISSFNSSLKNLSLSTPSFSCVGKLNHVEKLICKSGKLAVLDNQLNSLFSKMKDKNNLKEQREWLKLRNKCENETCVSNESKKRILELLNLNIYYSKPHNSLQLSDYYRLLNEYLLPHNFNQWEKNKLIPSYEDWEDCRICKVQSFLSSKILIMLSQTGQQFIDYFFSNLEVFVQEIIKLDFVSNYAKGFLLVNYDWKVIKNPYYLKDIGATKNNEYAMVIFEDADVEKKGIRRTGQNMILKTKENPGEFNVLENNEVTSLSLVTKKKQIKHWQWAIAKWLYRRGTVFGYIYSKLILKYFDQTKENKSLCEKVKLKNKSLYEKIKTYSDKEFEIKMLFADYSTTFKNWSSLNIFNYKKSFYSLPFENHCEW